MSDADGTCEYVLDPDNPETWGGEEGDKCYVDEEVLNEDEVWNCPHDAEEGGDLCIFHLPVKEKDDGEVINKFLNILDEEYNSEIQDGKQQFLSARFGKFDLSGEPVERLSGGKRVDLSYAQIRGEFNLSDLDIKVPYICFNGVNFEKNVYVLRALFEGDSYFQKAVFDSDVYFFKTIFDAVSNFARAKFTQMCHYDGTIFKQSTVFNGVQFSGIAKFNGVEFQKDTRFRGTEFKKDTKFRRTEFNGDTIFYGAKFRKGISFERAEFDENVDFRSLKLLNSNFSSSDLTDARLNGADCRESNFESALLSRTTLLGADLRGAKLSGAVIGDVRIDEETKFLGYPSDDSNTSPHTLSAIRSRQTCVYDPDYEEDNEHEDEDKAKSVYRALEELGGKHARPRLQARSFVRRQDLQKKDYWSDATADDASLEKRFIAGARWSRAKVARTTLLYGESPWRVIAWSLGIILFFAFSYPAVGGMKPEGGDPITYAQIVANPIEIFTLIYYSTLTYTALGFGDFQPVGLGRLLTTVETGLGAVMLALLVFILGRRAAR